MNDDESKALMDTYTRDSFFQPIFMTRDNLGVWGAPWEGQRRGEYTVLRKGGGLPGCSTFISFVPEFKFGISILMNSGTMAAEDLTFDLWTVLLPYIQSTLPIEPVKQATSYVSLLNSKLKISNAALPFPEYCFLSSVFGLINPA